MDTGALLLRLAVALVAARLAAEAAERFRQPAVLAEIGAGIVVGPSLLGLVHNDELLSMLGEIGAVLLMFQVGLHLDPADLRRVGRSALQVAAIGVVVPFVLGYVVLRALGLDLEVALFLAAGITATSVGITARVFADARALATPEARTVLGAAVADDVAGLLILTIVLGVASGDGIDAGSVAGTLGIALGFLVAAAVLGALLLPRMLAAVAARAHTDGVLTVGGLAFALALAGTASAARLAPIVGAFVAGVALARSDSREDLEHRLAPIGHVLVPLFFLGIGVQTRLGAFGEPSVLGVAAALVGVGVVGKLVSGLGVARRTAGRLLVGIAMIPRGEVGLIFAGIGLGGGIIDAREHATLVLVVLATTVVAPPWLRIAMERGRRAAIAVTPREPADGWFATSGDEVELAAVPPPPLTARVALEAAIACEERRPGERLLAWARDGGASAGWDHDASRLFLGLLRDGGPRAWRFLELSGLLARILPDVEASLRARPADPFDLDPHARHRLGVLDSLRDLVRAGRPPAREAWRRLPRKDLVRLAAFALSVFDGHDRAERARALAGTVGLPDGEAAFVSFLAAERHLLPAAAARADMGSEEAVLELAAHLATTERCDALLVLALAEATDPVERERLVELAELVRDRLSHPDLTGPGASDLVERRRTAAVRALARLHPIDDVRAHLAAAPRRYLLMHDHETIARHLRMTETPPATREVRLQAAPEGAPGTWIVDVVLADRPGALAAIAGAFASHRIPIQRAWISTWHTGWAIDVFRVRAPSSADWASIADSIELNLGGGSVDVFEIEAELEIDDRASPWHTIVNVRAPDREGLLYRVATAIARAGAQIHHAVVTTDGDVAVDSFFVTGRDGGKLDRHDEQALRTAFAGGVPRRPRRKRALAGREHTRHGTVTAR